MFSRKPLEGIKVFKSIKDNDIDVLVDDLLFNKIENNKFIPLKKSGNSKIIKDFFKNKLVKRVLSVSILILLFFALWSSNITSLYNDLGTDFMVSLEPRTVYYSDKIWINVSIPDYYNISSLTACMSENDTVDLFLIDNSSDYHVWNGNWIVHDLDPGYHIANIVGLNSDNVSYSAAVEWKLIAVEEDISDNTSDFNVSVNDTQNPNIIDNETNTTIVNVSIDDSNNTNYNDSSIDNNFENEDDDLINDVNFSELNDSEVFENTKQLDGFIGKPVSWIKQISVVNSDNHSKVFFYNASVPFYATKIESNYEQFLVFKENISNDNFTENIIRFNITLDAFESKIIFINYTTPEPELSEIIVDHKTKRVVVSSDFSYSNITAFTFIDNKPANKISLYHILNDSKEKVNFMAIDLNGDNLADRIEWVVPHLSEQIYEIVIEIEKAEHLDNERNFVSDISDEVKSLDGVLSEPIYDGEFVRVTFVQPLVNGNDITIFARSGGVSDIEVFTRDSNELISIFDSVTGEGWYKIYLSNLTGGFSTFDLRVVGDFVEYDYIVDPSSIFLLNPSPNGTTGVGLQPTCQIWANDTEGDTLTVHWYENTTGEWVDRQTNSSVSANSTVSWVFTQASNYSTTYWWKVDVDDGGDKITNWYYFTTEIDTSVDDIIPYVLNSHPLSVNATGENGLDNVTLWYRYSTDNTSWDVTGYWGWNNDTVDDNTSNNDSSSDIGNETNFLNCQDASPDSDLMTLQENDQGSINQVTFVSAGAGSAGIGSSITPAYPSSMQSGDLMLLQFMHLGTTGVADTPTGWTILDGPRTTSYGDGRVWIYYKFCTGTETGTLTVSGLDGDVGKFGRIYAFRNVSASSFYESVAWEARTSATVYDVNVTTTSSNELALNFVNIGEDYGNYYLSFSGETGGNWVEAVAEYYNSAGADGCLQLQIATMTSAATVNGGSYSMYNSDPYGVLGLALKPSKTYDYELDMEYQFNDSNYSCDNKFVCFYLTGSVSENLLVDYWNGSSWVNLGAINSIGWTNFSSIGLTSSTYNIRIRDQNKTNEVNQTNWTIDCILMYTYDNPLACDWVVWSDVGNPDSSSPWSWAFNFPNSSGYYEFYSIGKKSGLPDESAPASADAICYYYDTFPSIDLINPSPNGTTEVNHQPSCEVWVNDSDGNTLTVYWYENTTGDWVLRQTNSSVSANSTVSWIFSQAIDYGITYWWKVEVNDSSDSTTSWYNFITESLNTSVNQIIPYIHTLYPIDINATGSSELDNVSLWYRWSSDNTTWGVQHISIFEGFESGIQNTSLWNTYQTGGNARIQYNYGTAHSGSYSCVMDDADSDNVDYALNVLYTDYDFTNTTDITIDFWAREWGDEANEAPDSWTDWGNYDVVAFTNDGYTWYEIFSEADLNTATFTHFQYDISSDPNFTSPPTSDFAIAFQQYDNVQLTNDGRAWDDIYINYTTNESDWKIWDDTLNPDTSSPWSWNFDFPQGNGYYEFYSIGNKSGSSDELAPAIADTSCYLNSSSPFVYLINPSPNGTTGVGLQPLCQIWANDSDVNILTVDWYENTTGSWVLRNTNNSVNANSIVSYNFTQFNTYSTNFWWKVTVNDSIYNVSKIYCFTTEPIATLVQIIDSYNVIAAPLTINATGYSDYDEVKLYYRWSDDNSSWGHSGETIYDTPTIDNIASETNNAGASSMTWTHTVSSGLKDSILIVGTNIEEGLHDNYYVTSADFNGDALTFAVRAAADEGTADVSEIWYLLNPDAGSYTVRVNFSQAIEQALGGSVSFSNVNQSIPDNTRTTTDIGTPTGITTAINTPVANSLIVAVATDGQGTFIYSYGSGQTQIYDVSSSTHEGAGSRKLSTAAGTSNIYTNLSGASNRMSQVVATWAPSTTTWGNGTNWIQWNNASNPDTESPWSWGFDFPNLTGYYEFYSIGNKSGSPDELAPSSADARCRIQTIANEIPLNGSTNIQLIPQISINLNCIIGGTTNLTWYSNSSGSWQVFGVNNSVLNGTYHQINSNFSSPGTTYWWYVSVYDGVNTEISDTYHFTTSFIPVLSNPNPTNGSSTGYTTPACNVTVSDADGQTVTVRFYENTTGVWVLQQTNSSVDVTNPANVVWNNFSNATGDYTMYWWLVNVSDGKGCFVEAIYHFTTANTSIMITPDRWDQGVLQVGGSNETSGFYFNLTNNGDVPVYIQIKASNATNISTGGLWVLNTSAGFDNFTLQYNKSSGGAWTTINLTYDLFVASLDAGAWQTFDLKLIMATLSSTADPLSLDLTFRSVKG